jgi:hypothetical protein
MALSRSHIVEVRCATRLMHYQLVEVHMGAPSVAVPGASLASVLPGRGAKVWILDLHRGIGLLVHPRLDDTDAAREMMECQEWMDEPFILFRWWLVDLIRERRKEPIETVLDDLPAIVDLGQATEEEMAATRARALMFRTLARRGMLG